MYSKSRSAMYKVLKKTDIKPKGLTNFIYDGSILKYLDECFRVKFQVEIIQVPVYVNVYWEIIHSKLNYMTDEEIELLPSAQK